jgi:hypothetical protein
VDEVPPAPSGGCCALTMPRGDACHVQWAGAPPSGAKQQPWNKQDISRFAREPTGLKPRGVSDIYVRPVVVRPVVPLTPVVRRLLLRPPCAR